jgi:hypothetical protein
MFQFPSRIQVTRTGTLRYRKPIDPQVSGRGHFFVDDVRRAASQSPSLPGRRWPCRSQLCFLLLRLYLLTAMAGVRRGRRVAANQPHLIIETLAEVVFWPPAPACVVPCPRRGGNVRRGRTVHHMSPRCAPARRVATQRAAAVAHVSAAFLVRG